MPQPSSPYRSIPFDRRRFGRPKALQFPYLVELAISRVAASMEKRDFGLWRALRWLPVFRPDGEARRRSLRSDGALNIQTLLTTLIANWNIDSGLIIVPGGDSGPWKRLTWAELDRRAFGDLVHDERSLRRTERHVRALASLGYLEIIELRHPDQNGEIRSISAVKRLTAKFWDVLGLGGHVEATKSRRAQERRDRRAKELQKLERARRGMRAAMDLEPAPPALVAEIPSTDEGPPDWGDSEDQVDSVQATRSQSS